MTTTDADRLTMRMAFELLLEIQALIDDHVGYWPLSRVDPKLHGRMKTLMDRLLESLTGEKIRAVKAQKEVIPMAKAKKKGGGKKGC